MRSLLNIQSNIPKQFRYETKVPLDRFQFIDFMQYLSQLGLYPSRAYPNRRISSVYFDTADFSDYVDNISGIASRTKTRLRWYNEDISKVTLEHKIKENKASDKKNFPLLNPLLKNPRTMRGVREILANSKQTVEGLSMERLSPVLEVQYDREYFTLSESIRMTIDTNQKFKRLYPVPMEGYVTSPVYAVIEFKYPTNKKNDAQAMMRNLPFRLFRHSKYVIGMECTRP